MVYDLFTVSRKDLVRRACDELANGLHFFILHTMIDTARWGGSKINWMCFNSKKPTSHRIDRSYVGVNVGNVVSGNREKPWEAALHKDMSLFHHGLLPDTPGLAEGVPRNFYEGTTKDLRTLLHHVEWVRMKWNARAPEERSGFYRNDTNDPKDLCVSIRALLNFFLHRNMEVPSIVTVGVDDGPVGIAEREASAASAIMSYIVRLIRCCVLDRMRPSWEKSSPGMVPPPYALRASKECRDAAKLHFDNVRSINKLFLCMYGPGAMDRKDAFNARPREQQLAETRQKLVQLRGDVAEESALTVPSGASNAVLLGLWTRFGPSSPYDADVDAGEIVDFHHVRHRGAHDHLVKTNVYRHSISGQHRPDTPFVNKEHFFSVDPVGITNLDLINTALDLTGRGVRSLIAKAFAAYASRTDEFEHLARADGWRPLLSPEEMEAQRQRYGHYERALRPVEPHSVFLAMVNHMLRFRDFPMEEMFRIIEGPLATVFEIRREGGVHVCLFDEFLKKVRAQHTARPTEVPHPDTWEEIAQKFIVHTPYWSDPRYLGNFVDNFISDLQEHNWRENVDFELLPAFVTLQRAARAMVGMRDLTAHDRGTTSRERVNQGIDNLIAFMFNFRLLIVPESTGADVTELPEYKALIELRDALPHYYRWRGRQSAANKMDRVRSFDASQEVLRWLIEPDSIQLTAEERGGLGGPLGLAPSSEDALARLLLMSYPDDRAAGGGAAVATAAPTTTTAAAAASGAVASAGLARVGSGGRSANARFGPFSVFAAESSDEEEEEEEE